MDRRCLRRILLRALERLFDRLEVENLTVGEETPVGDAHDVCQKVESLNTYHALPLSMNQKKVQVNEAANDDCTHPVVRNDERGVRTCQSCGMPVSPKDELEALR